MNILKFDLDGKGEIGIILKTFDTLREMDEFLYQFNDANDVRKYYLETINDFLKTNEARNFINLNPNIERSGYITCYHKFKYDKMKKISILYKNGLVKNNIFQKLSEALHDPKVLKKIYEYKFYLLPSLFLKDELRRIIIHHGGKDVFIKEFIKYIKDLPSEEKYVYLRSLGNICNLLNNKEKDTDICFKIINISKIKEVNEYKLVYNLYGLKKKELEGIYNENEFEYKVYNNAPEYFKYIFNKAIEENDFDILFKTFTGEEIDLYSNYYEKGKVK